MCVSEPRQPLLPQDVFVSAAEDEQHPDHGSAHGSDVRTGSALQPRVPVYRGML